ncbi:unnamed protein product [Ceutorhynchus assimilis]|uniref:Uncharacterized protein n=1 Tax=Ceutorhynchus assimilis TaxID=467358 RepID=A0A9N9MII3_9CUCU|nr:unnamed protein product [Ceutorhynchus assimilis]
MHPYKSSASTTNLNKGKIISKPTVRGLHGEGDGARPKKPETPSRKIKIEKNTPQPSLKSASVAEITPTKTPIKRISTISTNSSEKYGTPRPFNETPKKQLCDQDFTDCKNSRFFLRCALKMSRVDTKTQRELIKKQKNQITQMEMEKDVLTKLMKSESLKREETQQECQLLKRNVDLLELENGQLNEEIQDLSKTVDRYRSQLKTVETEKIILTEQSQRMQETIEKNKSEKIALTEKISLRDDDINIQKLLITKLKAINEEIERNLCQARANYAIREKKYVHLKGQFKKQLEANNYLSLQLISVQQENQNASIRSEKLETQLNDYIESCATLKEVQESLKREVLDVSQQLEVEIKRQWLQKAKRIALLSFGALGKLMLVILPAYMERPVKFYFFY